MTFLDIAKEYGDPIAISKDRYEEAREKLDPESFRSQYFVQDGAYYRLGDACRDDLKLTLLHSIDKKLKIISLYAGIMVVSIALSVLLALIGVFL